MEITVIIPTIPVRKIMLQRAIQSVIKQTLLPRAIIIQTDLNKEGSAATRNHALKSITTPWVAFLDDDDEFLPFHLERLSEELHLTGADVVYSLPKVIGPNGSEISRNYYWGGGPEFDGGLLEKRAYIQTTSIVRTSLAVSVGGFEFIKGSDGLVNDDHGFYLRLYRAGAMFAHVHEPTFIWHHHGKNTSGQPEKV